MTDEKGEKDVGYRGDDDEGFEGEDDWFRDRSRANRYRWVAYDSDGGDRLNWRREYWPEMRRGWVCWNGICRPRDSFHGRDWRYTCRRDWECPQTHYCNYGRCIPKRPYWSEWGRWREY